MNNHKAAIYRAIGEMLYVVAEAGNGLTVEERMAFYAIAGQELEFDSWTAQSRCELLDNVTRPDRQGLSGGPSGAAKVQARFHARPAGQNVADIAEGRGHCSGAGPKRYLCT